MEKINGDFSQVDHKKGRVKKLEKCERGLITDERNGAAYVSIYKEMVSTAHVIGSIWDLIPTGEEFITGGKRS